MEQMQIIKAYAKKNNVPIMEEEGIQFLCDFIRKNNCKKILEIGTAIGYSSICMALLDPDIQITTIERDTQRYLIALENIKKCNVDKQIQVIHEDALECQIDGDFDLIFIDAAKSQYIKFFEKYSKYLLEDGYIISDNLNFHGFVKEPEKIQSRNLRQMVRKISNYIAYLKNHKEYETEFLELGDGVAISKKKQKNSI